MSADRVRDAIETAGGALVPFLTAGYPKLASTPHLLKAVDRAGASVIELGVPFSDSLADGPTVQQSYHQAIQGGMTLRTLLAQVAEVSPELSAPLVLMSSINPLLRMGLARAVRAASRAGVAGLLVPDLPAEDAGELRTLAADQGLSWIPLAAANSAEARYPLLAEGAGGFLYQMTRTGITGARSGKLPRGLGPRVQRAREVVGLPVCLGFGISTPAQVAEAWRVADGAVVGSALIREISAETTLKGQARRAHAFVSRLAGARR